MGHILVTGSSRGIGRAALEAGKSVVVDATNKDKALRRDWLSLFRAALRPGGRVRFVCFKLPVALAFHLNTRFIH
jgi:predicted kinase